MLHDLWEDKPTNDNNNDNDIDGNDDDNNDTDYGKKKYDKYDNNVYNDNTTIKHQRVANLPTFLCLAGVMTAIQYTFCVISS